MQTFIHKSSYTVETQQVSVVFLRNSKGQLHRKALQFAATLLCVALFVFGSNSVSIAQFTEDELANEMRAIYSRDGFIDEVIEKKRIAPNQRDAFKDHLTLVFSREGLIEYLAAEAYSLRDYLGDQDSFGRAASFGAALFQEKAALGIKRLDSQDQRVFWTSVYKIFDAVSFKDCASIFVQSADAQAMAAIELKGVAILSDDELRDYLSVTRKAIFAEIFDDPVYIPLGQTEREIAAQVFEDALVKSILDHPRADAILNAADMHDGLPFEDVCEFGLLTISTALDVKGTAGGWVVRYLSE